MKAKIVIVAALLFAGAGSVLASEMEKKVEEMLVSWPGTKVAATKDGVLHIVAPGSKVSQDQYNLMLQMTCMAASRNSGLLRGIREIRIMNRFRGFGWVYETPSKCEVVVNAPSSKVAIEIAANTHTCASDCKALLK